MYVQRFKLARPVSAVPVLFWHGGGLTGATWETTPDGRRGWHDIFMRAGFDTYVSDAVERGRASWARYPEINPGPPEHRTLEQAWATFRFGPEGGYNAQASEQKTYPGLQFPVASAITFAKQFVPRWSTSDAWIQSAYNAYVQQVCPCVIVAHSQAGGFAFAAAVAAPDKVKALILIEPSSAPDPSQAAAVAKVPMLVIWGDFIENSPLWQRYRGNVERFTGAIAKANGKVEVIDLPKRGIKGNSHMLMMDRNTDVVAGLAIAWLRGNRVR
jgi:pimeloyl-ACP methyl ester carboxylesterase